MKRTHTPKKISTVIKRLDIPVILSPKITDDIISTNDKSCELTAIEKRLMLSSYDIQSNDPDNILYQHSVLCQTVFPYKNPGDDVRSWTKVQGKSKLRIDAGVFLSPDTKKDIDIGLPFGPKPRLILAHINSQALKKTSPIIEVESSITAFSKRIGLAAHGRDIKAMKNHLSRLSAATIRLGYIEDNNAVQVDSQKYTP